MNYKIISTGSKGNAVVINNIVLIDCGVSFKALKEYYADIQLVLITHSHADHFQKSTIKKLASERPSLRFAGGKWLYGDLISLGVSPNNIDVLEIGKKYNYNAFKVSPVKLYHNVSCYGYRLYFGEQKLFYATDTSTLEGITAKDYDLYMIEANYNDEELQGRIKAKEEKGEFVYEYSVPDRHLSKAQADAFICENIGEKGSFVYLHQHE